MPELDDISGFMRALGALNGAGEGAMMPDAPPMDMMGGEMSVDMPTEALAAPYVMGETPPADPRRLIDWINHDNIAQELPQDILGPIGQRVEREYQIDLTSRQEAGFEDRTQVAMDLAMQIAKEKTHPWPGASNIIYPLMTTAGIQFAARAYPAIVSGRNVVKGVVVGPDNGIPMIGPDGSPVMQMTPQGPQPVWALPPGAKRERADRIGQHMSWQLLEKMREWEEETDKLLHLLPIIGCAFRKSYFDARLGCNVSSLVMPLNCVINYWAKSVERAPRISEDLKFYPVEIEEQIRAGLFLDQKYDAAENTSGDDDAPREFIEQHRYLDLDEDGYPEPYIVTTHKQSNKVARIVARYDEEGVHISTADRRVARIEPIHYYTKYDFIPPFDGGIYGVGFGQLLGPINSAINTTLNQIFDAGTLQNTGGGFIGRGLSMQSGAVKFKLGEWKVVNAPGQTVRDAIVPMQHPGPSPVLFQLLGLLVDAGKEVASVKDALTGETAAATMQPTTLMALIEQGLKVFTAIYKRVHRAAKQEYDKLYHLNRKYLEMDRFKVGDEWKTVTREDYARGAGVIPVSDPAMVSDMQKAARTQFLLSLAGNPLLDQKEIIVRALDAAQIENPDKLIVGQPPPNPMLIAQAAEMELKGRKTTAEIETEKAKQVETITRAVLNLANADKVTDDAKLAWISQYVDVLRLRLEALAQPAEGDGKAAALPAPDAAEPAALPPMPPDLSEIGLGIAPPMMAPEAQ